MAQAQSAAIAEACGAPAITAAEVTLNGDVRVRWDGVPGAGGRAVPGQAEAGHARRTRGWPASPGSGPGSSTAGDCGVFVATLRPMTMDTQLVARVSDAGAAPIDSAPRALTLSQWPEAVVETAEGSFVMRLFSDAAPGHVKHFVETALAHSYDGTLFHRVLPGDLVQGGDPIPRLPDEAAALRLGWARPAQGRVLRSLLLPRHRRGCALSVELRQRGQPVLHRAQGPPGAARPVHGLWRSGVRAGCRGPASAARASPGWFAAAHPDDGQGPPGAGRLPSRPEVGTRRHAEEPPGRPECGSRGGVLRGLRIPE